MHMKEGKGRLGRWQVFLQSHEITINHRKGKELRDADAISRLCINLNEHNHEKAGVINTCEDVDPIREEIKLHKQGDGRYLVPSQHVKLILEKYHDDPCSGGHDGFWRTYYKIKSRFTWSRMKEDISQYVKTCHICQITKFKYAPKYDHMIIAPHSNIKFEVVHIDFGEISKKSADVCKTKSFLIVIDEATRLTQCKAMKEDSRSVINYFNTYDYLKDVKVIISDNGKAFTSKAFTDGPKKNT